jgi:arylsulfatase
MEEDPKLEGQYPIPKETMTYSKLLQAQGYKTACIGKWGLGAPFTDGVPNKQGFDFFFGYNCQRQAHTYYPAHLWRNEEIVKLDNEFVIPKTTKLDENADPHKSESYAKFNLKQYTPELMLNEALSFIQSTKDQPFFLYVTTTIPHVPLQAPKEWVEKYRKKIGDEEPYLVSEGYFPCQFPRATYAAMVSYLDYGVGRIVEELKKLGIYENTIIIFSSDNGPINSGGTQSIFFNSTGPLNPAPDRQKGSLYEAGIRVPFIFSWPEKIKKSGVTDHICAAYDVFPTLCEITGCKVPDGLDGISMMPAILGKGKQFPHKYLYWEFPERGGQQAVRLGKWKALRKDIRKGNLNIQLFDLEKDLTEVTDIADKNPEIIKQIEEIMKTEHQKPEVDRFELFK